MLILKILLLILSFNLYSANEKLAQDFKNSAILFLDSDMCEFQLIENLKNNSNKDFPLYLRDLKEKKVITKNLYNALNFLYDDQKNLEKASYYSFNSRILSKNSNVLILEENDIQGMYRGFKIWPDDKQKCLYKEFRKLLHSFVDPKHGQINRTAKFKIMKLANVSALSEGYISTDSFNRLEYLRRDSKFQDFNLRALLQTN